MKCIRLEICNVKNIRIIYRVRTIALVNRIVLDLGTKVAISSASKPDINENKSLNNLSPV